jgi:hypothetical protein
MIVVAVEVSRRPARVVLFVLLAALTIAACGSGHNSSSDQTSGEQTKSEQQLAQGLLRDWKNKLLPALISMKQRSDLFQAGLIEESVRAGKAAEDKIQPILAFGKDARVQFVKVPPSELTKAMIATGDAWTKWALAAKQLLPNGGTSLELSRRGNFR